MDDGHCVEVKSFSQFPRKFFGFVNFYKSKNAASGLQIQAEQFGGTKSKQQPQKYHQRQNFDETTTPPTVHFAPEQKEKG